LLLFGAWICPLFAVSNVLTRSYDNGRTGANTSETKLTPANAGSLHKLFSLNVPDDPRIEAQPLYVPNMNMADGVHNVMFVCSMANTVYAFDADTGAKLWTANLGTPFRPNPGDAVDVNPPINVAWGILATPVIDVDGSTIYIANWIVDAAGNRQLRLNALRLRDGQIRHHALPIQAQFKNAAGQTITLNQVQKQRAALLLTPLRGGPTVHKILYVTTTGAESPPTGGDPTKANHGWVIAFDTNTWRQTAAWIATPSSFGGGIWQASQGPAADENNNVYLITSNGGWIETSGGKQDFNGKTDFAECFVKLKYTPGTVSKLTLIDWFSPFLDSKRREWTNAEVAPFPKGYDYTDQDLGSGGAVVPAGENIVLGGGKDGVLYVLNRAKFGKSIGDLSKLKTPPSFFSWIPDPSIPAYAGATPTGNMDYKPMQGVKTGHLHGTPIYWNPPGGPGPRLFVQGENEFLRAWSMAPSGATTQLAHGAERASAALADPNNPSLGGMPGGMLTLSSNGAANGIVWVTAPVDGDANRQVVAGVVRAYDATNFDAVNKNADGTPRIKLLWSATGFSYSKFCPPVVINGKLYVPTYDGRVDVYGL
jgi:outer membrane protein assembly factor BamB